MKTAYKCFLILPLLIIYSCTNTDTSNKNRDDKIPSDSLNTKETNQETSDTKLDNGKKSSVDYIRQPNKAGNEIVSAKSGLYSLRKYEHVTTFYNNISVQTIEICMDNNVPPAAILAIAGLESGWNKGYVGRITGNILSLGTRKGDIELPALRLPRLKSNGQILFDSLEIIKYTAEEIQWENRPPSLKKDYRPLPYAGTKYNLAYFKYHPAEKVQAQIQNLNDFVTIFISRNSRIKAYKGARELMDNLVATHGKEILLSETTAVQFINEIGGKPNSFNYRETWPIKVTYILKNAGLIELTTELHEKNNEFKNVW